MRANVEYMEKMVEGGCQKPGCKHSNHTQNEIFVQQKCHPGAGLSVRYQKGSGLINILCRKCEQPVLDVGVALI